MADSKIPLSDLPAGVPGAYDKVAGVDTATGASRLFPMPQAGVPRSYATRASLPAASGFTDGYTVWVNNDPTPANNGTWSVQSGAWVQSADRVTGLEGRTAAIEDLTASTKRVATGVNLFNPAKATAGVRLDNLTGLTFPDSSQSTSGFIPADAATDYRMSYSNRWAAYDANKAFIAGSSPAASPTFTTPAGTAFIRVSVATPSAGALMVVRGPALPGSYVPYTSGVEVSDLIYDSAKVATVDGDGELDQSVIVTKQNVDFLTRQSPNLYDTNAAGIVEGFRINHLNGNIGTADANNSASDFIPVDPNTAYAVTEGSYTAQYDANRVYLTGHGIGVLTFTSHAEAAFVRTTVRNVRRADFMMVEGATVPTIFVPYDRWALDPSILQTTESRRYEGKKWNVLGDSITAATGAYWSILAGQLGFSVARNYGVGGTAVAVRDAPWDTNAMCIRYSEMDDDADLITVMCGTNDFNQVPLGAFSDTVNTTFYGALHILCAGLVDKYPTNLIAFFTLPPRYNMQVAGLGGHTVFDYADAIKRVCQHYAIPVFDTLRSVQLRPYNDDNKAAYIPDGLHPNSAGHHLLAGAMRTFVEDL